MAQLKLDNLVLRGVCVVSDGVFVLERIGSCQAAGEAMTAPTSFARHLPLGDPDNDPNPDKRGEHATTYAVGRAAPRAGRSGSLAGVLGSSPLARSARPAILSGWPVSTGGTAFAGCDSSGRLPVRGITLADLSLGHPQSSQCVTGQPAARLAFSRPEGAGERGEAESARYWSLQGMRSASA
ncbi:MAG: hypothetical protein IT429_21140 [Gemmataceae bacterium]|nr:hypothetical protein [Gemmataceae bacterium]